MSVTGELSAAAATLRQLEMAVTRRLDGLLHGDHLGLLPGPGSEAGDGRLYQPGDDVRRIDWNLTARSNATHVRELIADRELETWFVVDRTASVDYGTTRREKRDLGLAVVAAFGFLTARAGNRAGAVVYGGASTDVVAPAAGRDALLGLLHRLEGRAGGDGDGEGSLADALRRVGFLARRRGLVVVVSDLLDGGEWPTELRALAVRHDVVVARVADPREDELPPVGLLTLVDPETGRRQEVQTSSRRFRERYAAAARTRRDDAAAAVHRAGASLLEVSTERDWLLDVVRFTVARRRRR